MTLTAAAGASKAGGFDRAAYTELAELGLCGLYISEADGGPAWVRSRAWW